MRVLLLFALVVTTAGTAVGENHLFLDFNRDNNLNTIETVSEANPDTVTLIFEFNAVFHSTTSA